MLAHTSWRVRILQKLIISCFMAVTCDTCTVPTIIFLTKMQKNKETFLIAKRNAVSENLSFLRRVCVQNKAPVKFSLSGHFCIIFLRASCSKRLNLMEMTLLFAFDRCKASICFTFMFQNCSPNVAGDSVCKTHISQFVFSNAILYTFKVSSQVVSSFTWKPK